MRLKRNEIISSLLGLIQLRRAFSFIQFSLYRLIPTDVLTHFAITVQFSVNFGFSVVCAPMTIDIIIFKAGQTTLSADGCSRAQNRAYIGAMGGLLQH